MRDQTNLPSAVTCRVGLGILVMAMVVALLPFLPGTAEAAGPSVFINEIHYDNASTDTGEGIEIAGPAGANLAGWSVVLYNGSNGTPYDTINLAGTIPNQQSGFGTLHFPQVGIQNGTPDGLALVDAGSAVIELLSYEGTFVAIGGPADGIISTDIGVFEPGITLSGKSLQLTGSGTMGGDFTWAAPQTNTFGAVNTGQNFGIGVINPGDLVINEIMQNPAAVTDLNGEWFEVFNTTDGPIDMNGFVIKDDGSNTHTISLSVIVPAGGFAVLGNNSGSSSNGGVTVDYQYSSFFIANGADEVVILDGTTEIDRVNYDGGITFPDPTGASMALKETTLPNNVGANWCESGSAFGDGDFGTPGAANDCPVIDPIGVCGDAATLIHDIQGAGLVSPEVGNIHEIEGVVVGDFQGGTGLNGFFVQEENADADANPNTSEGIFVFDSANLVAVNVGDVVRVRGKVAELFGLTQLTSVNSVAVCASSRTATAASVTLPVASIGDFEAFEGMAVTFPQDLYIAEFFDFDRFGEIVLATDRQFQPTAVFEPGSTDQSNLVSTNQRSRITLDDGRTSQNPDPTIHPNGSVFDLTNLFRGGDSVQGVTGVMDYAFGLYRIQPTQGANYTLLNPRPALPDIVGGSLTVASFNVLNYFTTLDDSGSICGPAADQGCRGADNATEFTRQRDKIISAIVTMDADIVGLMEIENHSTDAAINNLVDGLNAIAGAGIYAAINTGPIGDDAIKVGLIYQPASVTPVGAFAVLDSTVDPTFNDTRNRPVLAQTFEQNGTGERFTAVVNHLKSKSSSCADIGDPDLGDGQGNCNRTRTAAAVAEAVWLATDPTGSADADFLIIGDLNSYDREDPIDALLAGSYTDLLRHEIGEFAYSYVYDGQLGYLDHALANADLLGQVTGVTVWHINADEPDLIDYETSFKPPAQDALYAPDAYRSSDHDPVLIGLELVGDSDSDGDGVLDSMDACPNSDLSSTVVINSCDSDVPNQVVFAGCSIMDGINACPTDSQGKLSSCVSHLTNGLKFAGLITGKEKGRIQKCAKLPKEGKPKKKKKK